MIKGNIEKIEDLAFRARMYADRDAFKKLYTSMRFIMDEIYNAFATVYDFIKNNKSEFYQKFYIETWDCVYAYDFNSDIGFPIFFKKFLIKKIKKYMFIEYGIKQNHIVSDETIDKIISNNKNYYKKWMEKEHYLNAISEFSGKQLKAIYLDCYKGMTRKKAAKYIGLSVNTYNDRLRLTFKRVRNYYYGLRNNEIKERIHETIYIPKINQEKNNDI